MRWRYIICERIQHLVNAGINAAATALFVEGFSGGFQVMAEPKPEKVYHFIKTTKRLCKISYCWNKQ
jgi:hypothetical protein